MTMRMRRMVATVLNGQVPYDDVPADVQALVRAAWDERIASTLADLNYETEFRAAGRSWVEADEMGRTIVRNQPTHNH